MAWCNDVYKKLIFSFSTPPNNHVSMRVCIYLSLCFCVCVCVLIYTYIADKSISIMASKEEGIKLFGKTITLHGRQAVRSEDQKRLADQTVEKRPDKVIPCPRCKSMETKFCYFNNYNVNQPRHFCKACQRYWTAGGALRNVPVGAGRRKNKPPGIEGGGGFSVDGGFYDGSSGVHQIELDGVVVEEWHVTAHGSFQHVFPVKRRRSSSDGQTC